MNEQPDISGYGNFGSQDPNSFSIDQPEDVQPVEGTSSQTDYNQSVSSLSKSELEALIAMIAAGVPVLQMPSFYFSVVERTHDTWINGVSSPINDYGLVRGLLGMDGLRLRGSGTERNR